MLPIRWIVSAGGVFLALALLALAFNAADGLRLAPLNMAAERNAIIELGERPEWRQFLILSAIQRRADELNRLRDLPDSPVGTVPTASKVAGPPTEVPAIQTGLNVEPLAATNPLDTGEPWSIEFPIAASAEEKSLTTKTPQRVKSRHQNRGKGGQHVRRAPTAPANRDSLLGPFGEQTWQTPTPNATTY